MIDSSNSESNKLDPEFRERLLNESKNPFRGIRRLIWIALFGSASLGLLIMMSRSFAGLEVSRADSLIQIASVLIFGSLLFLDKSK